MDSMTGLTASEEVYMTALNDYLFSGDTVLKILLQYSEDLKNDAIEHLSRFQVDEISGRY